MACFDSISFYIRNMPVKVEEGLTIISHWLGRTIFWFRNIPEEMHHNPLTASIFMITTIVTFIFANQVANRIANMKESKTKKDGETYATILAGSVFITLMLGSNILISRITQYSLSKLSYVVLSIFSFGARYMMNQKERVKKPEIEEIEMEDIEKIEMEDIEKI